MNRFIYVKDENGPQLLNLDDCRRVARCQKSIDPKDPAKGRHDLIRYEFKDGTNQMEICKDAKSCDDKFLEIQEILSYKKEEKEEKQKDVEPDTSEKAGKGSKSK